MPWAPTFLPPKFLLLLSGAAESGTSLQETDPWLPQVCIEGTWGAHAERKGGERLPGETREAATLLCLQRGVGRERSRHTDRREQVAARGEQRGGGAGA